MTGLTREAAAAARAQQVRQRADRPSQRRSAEQPGARAAARVPATIELREAPETGLLEFVGHASAYESGYTMWDWYGPYTEIVSAGAGAESLARADLDVPLVLGHDQLRRLARTTTGSLILAEDETGLSVHAPALDPVDYDVAYIAPKLRAGLIDEMSFAFRIEAGQWSPDYMEYRITRYDIHRGDVAIVGYGANPATDAGLRAEAAVKAAEPAGQARARALLELALHR
ncbi:HK97 family phage prohead protease [Streptosporangium sp. NPDC051023]|uniref:HK97 family phage prohead protease n=1 Tax=Streptosporangium sp. NPDC051023 TaxID=3155410 RepID=UPI00344BB514